MAFDTLKVAAQAARLIASFGLAAPANAAISGSKAALKKAITEIGEKAVFKGVKAAYNAIKT